MTDTRAAPKRIWPKIPLPLQIVAALGLAVVVGAVFDPGSFGGRLLPPLEFVGTFFLRLLKMLVLPLIVSSIIVGIAGGPVKQGMGRLGLVTATLYLLTSLVAIVIGLGSVLLIAPGRIDGRPARELIGLSADLSTVLAQVEGKNAQDLVGVFLRMIPENIVADAAAGNLLGVIVFAILFGIFLNRIPAEPQRSLVGFFRGVEQVMLELTHAVLRLSPLGVFALVAKVAMTTGFAAVKPLGWFVVTVLGALVIHAFVVVPILLVTVARVNPLRHFRGMAPALLMAFSTASSSGTLPLTMQSASRLGISERVTGFTLPLGATVNMDGTALYECVAAVFIAQAYGVDLGFAQLFVIALVALLTSVGVAGIPAASLVAIALILTSMGLPLEGLGLILAVDRVLDMCRTSVNVLGDSTVAACVQRLVPAGEGAAEGASPG